MGQTCKSVQGDQASIINGAINFMKELEHFLQFLEVQKQLKEQPRIREQSSSSPTNPLSSFLASPQYSSPPLIVDIKVGIVESHANLKLLSYWRPKQLLKLLMGLQNLQLTVLHLNVTSVEPMVLYSFSLKVEDDCQLNSVDEIAAAVHEIVLKNQEEAVAFHPWRSHQGRRFLGESSAGRNRAKKMNSGAFVRLGEAIREAKRNSECPGMKGTVAACGEFAQERGFRPSCSAWGEK